MLHTLLKDPVHNPLKSGTNSENAGRERSLLKERIIICFDWMIETRNVITLGGRDGLFPLIVLRREPYLVFRGIY